VQAFCVSAAHRALVPCGSTAFLFLTRFEDVTGAREFKKVTSLYNPLGVVCYRQVSTYR